MLLLSGERGVLEDLMAGSTDAGARMGIQIKKYDGDRADFPRFHREFRASLGATPYAGATLLDGLREPRPVAVKTQPMSGTAVKTMIKPTSLLGRRRRCLPTRDRRRQRRWVRTRPSSSGSELGTFAMLSSQSPSTGPRCGESQPDQAV